MAAKQTTFQVLHLIYPNHNALDMVGPMDVLGSASLREVHFHSSVASATEITRSYENLHVQRTLSLDEVLDPAKLEQFDILIVPGGWSDEIEELIQAPSTDKADRGIVAVVRAFAKLPSRSVNRPRWLFSVCTGAAFLAAAGVLTGKTATTHWMYLDRLREICATTDAAAKSTAGTQVVRKRFINVGEINDGIRILTAGGVSCGIDATLWLLSQLSDLDTAVFATSVMDYRWEFADGNVTDGYVVDAQA